MQSGLTSGTWLANLTELSTDADLFTPNYGVHIESPRRYISIGCLVNSVLTKLSAALYWIQFEHN